MGNRLCKKKSDVVDNAQNVNNNNNRSPSKFDRIINRLHLKPTAWKSESQLSKKQANRCKSEEKRPSKHGESIFYTKPLSKSSDWTEVDLEVPSKEDEHIHLRNPKLSLIFDNDKGTPTPPPRKHHRDSKEKLDKKTKSTLQAVQNDNPNQNNQIPVEEPLMVKKKINYNCPLCDSDEKNHNRDHHHPHHEVKTQINSGKLENTDDDKKSKSSKRKKNLSVISLPNYTDLKLSVADSDPLTPKTASRNDLNSSRLSLQNPGSKKLTSSQSTGKLDTYITRCRSFGSILPQQLKKFIAQKPKPVDITSDDSFGALEDWDLGLIEHYNPKDASLPRPRKSLPQKASNKDVLSDIESLIVKEEEIQAQKPKAPARRIESLVKKFNKEPSKTVPLVAKPPEDVCLTPPPSPESKKQVITVKSKGQTHKPQIAPPTAAKRETVQTTVATPPKATFYSNTKQEEPVEHSSLMRILQEFSMKDKQQDSTVGNDSDLSSLTPSLVEFEKNLNNNLNEDFINAEKSHTKAIYS